MFLIYFLNRRLASVFLLGPRVSFKIDGMLVDFLAIYVHNCTCSA